MGAGRFNNAVYGPMALRPVLRRVLIRGETVVGFGVLTASGGMGDPAFQMLAMLVPALAALGPRLMRDSTRVAVLTDARLLLLPASRLGLLEDASHADLNAPLHSLHIDVKSDGRYLIGHRDWPSPRVFMLADLSTRPAKQLAAGLKVLAEDGATGQTRADLASRGFDDADDTASEERTAFE